MSAARALQQRKQANEKGRAGQQERVAFGVVSAPRRKLHGSIPRRFRSPAALEGKRHTSHRQCGSFPSGLPWAALGGSRDRCW